MVVASQQITVKVDPAVEAEGKHDDRGRYRERNIVRERREKSKRERRRTQRECAG